MLQNRSQKRAKLFGHYQDEEGDGAYGPVSMYWDEGWCRLANHFPFSRGLILFPSRCLPGVVFRVGRPDRTVSFTRCSSILLLSLLIPGPGVAERLWTVLRRYPVAKAVDRGATNSPNRLFRWWVLTLRTDLFLVCSGVFWPSHTALFTVWVHLRGFWGVCVFSPRNADCKRMQNVWKGLDWRSVKRAWY